MEVLLVPIEDTDLHWLKVKDFINKAVYYTNGMANIDDVYNTLLTGKSSLWVVYKDNNAIGGLITSISLYPQKTILNVQFCGGVDFKEWKDIAFNAIRQYAKEHDCQAMQVAARPGWGRIFKDDGCKLLWSTFEIAA